MRPQGKSGLAKNAEKRDVIGVARGRNAGGLSSLSLERKGRLALVVLSWRSPEKWSGGWGAPDQVSGALSRGGASTGYRVRCTPRGLAGFASTPTSWPPRPRRRLPHEVGHKQAQRALGVVLHRLLAVPGHLQQRRPPADEAVGRLPGHVEVPGDGGHVAVELAQLGLHAVRRQPLFKRHLVTSAYRTMGPLYRAPRRPSRFCRSLPALCSGRGPAPATWAGNPPLEFCYVYQYPFQAAGPVGPQHAAAQHPPQALQADAGVG